MSRFRDVIVILCLVLKTNFFISCISANEDCTAFTNFYQDRIAANIVPSSPQYGTSLKYCPTSEKTCCTSDVEEKLKDLSKLNYEKAVRKELQTLSRILKSKSTKFNEYFKDLLTKSKKDLHEMFKKTYGMVYEQNSYVFSDFFAELERYYTNGKSNLGDVMETFFNILYQKMFTVLNTQYKFDDKYLGCISEHMNELEPFGDVPQKFSNPLKRSFVAARTYSQSLNVVGDIVSNLIYLVPTDSCLNAITKMLHCSSCKGLNGAKVCTDFCLNVMKGCLGFYTEIDNEWSAFVDAMSKVEQRLSRSYNIEQVVEPINVKISEAIMNFQENANAVTSKVFNGCGKPPLNSSRRRRRRRQATGFSESDEFEEHDNRQPNSKSERRRKENNRNRNDKNRRKNKDSYDLDEDRNNPADGFLKFIQEIGTQVLGTKYFWKRLPYHVCNDEMQVESNKTAACWNGKSMGRYESPLVSDGLKNQQSNPEVTVDPKSHAHFLSDQILALKSVSTQLRNAYNGYDVEWIDSEEAFDVGSGSGMGPDRDNGGIDSGFEGSGDSLPPVIFSGKPETPTVKTDDSSSPSTSTNTSSSTDVLTSSTTATVDVRVLVESSTSFTDTSLDSSTIRISTSTVSSTTNNTSSGTSIRYQKISLNKAIASYLLPTVVMWMGGSFNDWFNSLV
ncbi:glypican-6 [Planococcus citri]|uniref:glypican-6 n=1 Tax=Planococcus citri TaxID=170843 RepID=UPI0031F9A86E